MRLKAAAGEIPVGRLGTDGGSAENELTTGCARLELQLAGDLVLERPQFLDLGAAVVHRRRNITVSHHVLHLGQIRVSGAEPRTVTVSESMPTKIRQLQFSRLRLDDLAENGIG